MQRPIHVVLGLWASTIAGAWIGISAPVHAESNPPVPTDAKDGDFVEIDGVLYEVVKDHLEPLDDPQDTDGKAGNANIGTQKNKKKNNKKKTSKDRNQAIEVTATRLDVDPSQVTVHTDVIDGDEIAERGARTLADVLRQESGIQINSSLGTGQQIFIDGLDGKYVLVLLDGRPINGRVDNRLDLTRLGISASQIERVEVVRGPMSALYGSEALGGVVNIITKRPKDGVRADMTVDGALTATGINQAGLAAHLDGGFGALAWKLDANLQRAYSLDRGGRDSAGQVSLTPDGRGDLPDRRQWQLGGEATIFANRDWFLRSYFLGLGQDVETQLSSALPFRDTARSSQMQVGVVAEGEIAAGHLLTIDVRGDRFDHRFGKLPTGGDASLVPFCNDSISVAWPFDENCPRPLQTRTLSTVGEGRLEIRYRGTWQPEPLTLERVLQSANANPPKEEMRLSWSLGAVLAREGATRIDGEGNDTLPGGGLRHNASLYGELLYQPWRGASIVPGFRLDTFTPGPQNQDFDVSFTPKISMSFALPWQLTVRSSYGQGFRLPSFQERFLLFDHSELGYIVNGNPNLLPETSHGLRAELVWKDVSHTHEQQKQRAQQEQQEQQEQHWQVSVEGFLNILDQLISETGGTEVSDTGIPIFSYANVARAYTAGINTSLLWTPIEYASIQLNYQYLANAVDASRCPESNPYFCTATEGAVSLPLRAAHALHVKGRYQFLETGTTIFSHVDYLDARPIAATEIAPAFIDVGIGIQQMLGDQWTITASWENLLDIYDPTFGPKPGRFAQASIRATF